MKVSGLSSKANSFEGENYELPIFSESGVRIRIIELDGHLRIMIEVGEKSTNRQIRDAIPLALEWRDRLLEWQGPWIKGGSNEFLERLLREHDRGISYAALARKINQRLSDLLEIGEIEWARDQLLALRMGSEEVVFTIDKALAQIEDGKPPFEDGYPISREKLIGTLRYWKGMRKEEDS